MKMTLYLYQMGRLVRIQRFCRSSSDPTRHIASSSSGADQLLELLTVAHLVLPRTVFAIYCCKQSTFHQLFYNGEFVAFAKKSRMEMRSNYFMLILEVPKHQWHVFRCLKNLIRDMGTISAISCIMWSGLFLISALIRSTWSFEGPVGSLSHGK